jgi:hypothetical protein
LDKAHSEIQVNLLNNNWKYKEMGESRKDIYNDLEKLLEPIKAVEVSGLSEKKREQKNTFFSL